MARTVNERDYAVKRNEILDVAQRLIYSRGYEQIAINDILSELQISKGAFYHYFDSKRALLEALIERTQQHSQQILITILQDSELPALAKLQRLFDVIGRWKTAQKGYLLALLHVWYADENALVRHRIQATMLLHTSPLLTAVIQQGVAEGALTTSFPGHAGTLVLNLLLGLGERFVPLLSAALPAEQALAQAEQLVAAYNDALERLLGAPAGSLALMDPETLREWFVTTRKPAAADAEIVSSGRQNS